MSAQTTSVEEAAHLSGAEGWPGGGGTGATTPSQVPRLSGPYLPQGKLATNKPNASMWRKRKQEWEKEVVRAGQRVTDIQRKGLRKAREPAI